MSRIAKTTSKIIAASIVALFASATGVQVNAQYFDHIDELGMDISAKTNLLLQETRHYRHTPEYVHMVNDAVALRRSAARVCALAQRHASVYHLEAELALLDQSFHHLEGVFDTAEIEAAHGHGHIHGPTTHVKELLESIEDCIHHMQEDVAALRRASHRVTRVYRAPVYRAPVYEAPVIYERRVYRAPGCSTPRVYSGYGRGHDRHYDSRTRGGITVGNDSFRFRINF